MILDSLHFRTDFFPIVSEFIVSLDNESDRIENVIYGKYKANMHYMSIVKSSLDKISGL